MAERFEHRPHWFPTPVLTDAQWDQIRALARRAERRSRFRKVLRLLVVVLWVLSWVGVSDLLWVDEWHWWNYAWVLPLFAAFWLCLNEVQRSFRRSSC